MISLATLGFSAHSPLPSFNTWAMSLESYREGELDEETLRRDFSRFWEEVWSISGIFRSELRYQLEPEWRETLARAARSLEYVENSAFGIGQLQESSGWEAIDADRVQAMKNRLDRLFESFAEVRALEESRPRLAESPPLHELLRCAALYAEGRLSGELLEERLASVVHHFRGLYERLDRSPLRHPAVDRMLEILERLLEDLAVLEAQLKAGEKPLDPEALAGLAEAARRARRPQQTLAELEGVRTGWCSQCEGLVALPQPEAERCPLCATPIGAGAPEMEVWPEHFQVLLTSLRAASEAGPGRADSWNQARRALEEALARLQQARLELPKILAVGEDPPPCEVEPVLATFERACALVGQALDGGDALRLRSCLEDLEQACDEMCRLQREMAAWIQQHS